MQQMSNLHSIIANRKSDQTKMNFTEMICRDDNLFWHQTHNYSSLDQAVLQDVIIENESKISIVNYQ